MQPAVSIILPTYNRMRFLRDAVASVFAQTFQDWELIIADDGSDDDTSDYLRSLHAPPAVRVIWLTHSGRAAVARNAALRASTGKYFAFLDSDDVWLPQKLAAQVSSLSAGCGWGYTSFRQIDASGTPLGPPRDRSFPALSGWILESLLKTETVITPSTVMISRDLIDRVGCFDERLTMCEDYELWLRMAAAANVEGIGEALTLIRRHDEHSGSDVIAWRDRRLVVDRALRTCGDARLRFILRKLHAELSAGLASSQATAGQRFEALQTLVKGAPSGCCHHEWWARAMAAMARALLPESARKLVRAVRQRRVTYRMAK